MTLRGIEMIYANRGEVVICLEGHSIAEVVRAVHYGETIDPSALSFCFNTDEPRVGTRDIDCWCSECGSMYFKDAKFHFKDGWR